MPKPPSQQLTPDQIEAIECADAHARNNDLPTYTELLHSLNRLSVEVLHAPHLDQHDPLRTTAQQCTELACGAL